MSEKVADLGEFGLIAAITARLPQASGVIVGPGDDAAVLATADGRVVVTTDLLVENRHFRRDWSSADDIGHKAAAQIAAPGGPAAGESWPKAHRPPAQRPPFSPPLLSCLRSVQPKSLE